MTTAVQVQYRRGTSSQVASFTGAAGEMVIDTTNNRVVVQDGSTAGGFPAAKLNDADVAFTGGTIDGTVIGGSTPAAASVTAPGGGDSSSRAITSAWHGQNQLGGFLNKFRNGTMDVWQHGTSLTVATSGGYTADGWIVRPTGASVTAAQAGGRLLTKASLQVTGASSVTDVIVKQRIESLIAAALCSQTVTVQAQIYNGTGGAIAPTLTVNRPGAQDNYSSVTADVNAVNLQSCANGAWTQIAYTFSANAASYNGLEISFDFGNNFGSSSNSIQITECDIRVTPGVSTGLNGKPPPPELRLVATELPFCQRYYQIFGGIANYVLATGFAFSATAAYCGMQLFCPMRVAPTLNYSSASAIKFLLSGGSPVSTAISFGDISTQSFYLNITATGMTAGYAGFLFIPSSADSITATAEL